ncbi:hypothetical protein GIB67_039136 [Kingdonia uniflora]|uniref:Uncharacterized protein n=1 Tax=Kingdonia uniflora TaxID=39325 RepID=A0A7J7MLK4_9MAGN|nr:hypothetical protein GIB67_039136 [Kingdonia uniflora]
MWLQKLGAWFLCPYSHSNAIATLFSSMMTTLRKLLLTGNPLRTLRSSLVSGPTPTLLKYLRSRVSAGEDVLACSLALLLRAPLNIMARLDKIFSEFFWGSHKGKAKRKWVVLGDYFKFVSTLDTRSLQALHIQVKTVKVKRVKCAWLSFSSFPTKVKWGVAEGDVVTLNTERSCQSTKRGCGAMLRNNSGTVLGAVSGTMDCASVPVLELNAVKMGLRMTVEKGHKKIAKLEYFDIIHIYSETNRAADALAGLHFDVEYIEIIQSSFSEDLKKSSHEDVIDSGSASTPTKEDQITMAARSSVSSKELSLSGLSLNTVPPAVWETSEIVKVDLSRNSIQELPNELSTCIFLQALILSGNKIKEWPESVLQSLPNLVCLKLANNPITQDYPDVALASVGCMPLARRAREDGCLHNLPLGYPPRPSQSSTHLSADSSSPDSYALSVLSPDEISRFRQIFSLSSTSAVSHAGNFASGNNVFHLRIRIRLLTQIPSHGFESLSKLQILDLSGNAGSLPKPPALSCLSQLQELYLRRMQLHEVPSDLLSLHQLRIVDLSQNSITSIPKEFKNFNSLIELDLTDNNITTLPPELGLLESSLQALRLDGNPLRTIRRAVLDRGTKAVLNYLKERIPE